MEDRIDSKKIFTGFVFAFFFLITCFKLTNAGLWYDETIEYWYSKILVGRLPFRTAAIVDTTNMYQRIIATYQPPLYNILMFFWLKISEGEWWFRFFSVLMGFVCNLGIYKAIKALSNEYIASFAVLFATCNYQLVYYWQECSEYSLVLAMLAWTLYFWFALLQNANRCNIICFTIFAVLAVYSQYGAAFPISCMAIIALIDIVAKKNKGKTFCILSSYFAAIILAALPLYFFFLKRQMVNQAQERTAGDAFEFSGTILGDMWKNFLYVFKWCFFPYMSMRSVKMIALMILLMVILLLIFRRKKMIYFVLVTNTMTWVLYYFAVKANLYSYGAFGRRYNLFFIPLWLISAFIIGIEFYHMLSKWMSTGRMKEVPLYYVGACLCFIFCSCYMGWSYEIENNWEKDDMRGAVETWIRKNGQESNTLVYYGGNSGFGYYIRQWDGYYDGLEEEHITYMKWYRDKSVEEYTQYMNEIYGNEWPKEIYVIGTHLRDDFDTLVEAFTNIGYEQTKLFDSNGRLLLLTLEE